MSSSREISQFAGLVTVNDTTDQVSIASTVNLSAAGALGVGVTSPTEKLDVSGNIKSSGSITGSTLSGTLQTAAQTNITSVGTLTELDVNGHSELDNVNVSGAITATTFTGNLAGTVNTAAQPNITSVGTLSALTVSGDTSIADKITHTGDTDTAIRFPADNTFTVETAGSERVRVDSSGNIGVGTPSISFPSGSGVEIYDSSTPRLKLSNGTTGTGSTDGSYLYVSGSDLLIENKESANMRFYTSADEAMRLNSSGYVGIGTTNPSNILHTVGNVQFDGTVNSRGAIFGGTVGGTSEVTIGRSSDANFALLDFVADSTYTDYALRIIRGNTGSNAYSQIRTRGLGTLSIVTEEPAEISLNTHNTQRLGISSTGVVNVKESFSVGPPAGTRTEITNPTTNSYDIDSYTNNYYIWGVRNSATVTNCLEIESAFAGDIVFKAQQLATSSSPGSAAERMRVLRSGGLTFNGDTAAANALDDYEEGTWTPSFAVESGSFSITYTTQTGRYTKIGRQVIASFRIVWSAFSNTSGNILTINGLPISAASASNLMGFVSEVRGMNFESWGGVTSATALALQGYTSGRGTTSVMKTGSTVSDSRGRISMLLSSGEFQGTFVYTI